MSTCPDDNFRNPELAVQAAEKAIALDGDTDYHYLETLAVAQASAGDFEAAISTQKKAIELVPNEQQQRAQLGHRPSVRPCPAVREWIWRRSRGGAAQAMIDSRSAMATACVRVSASSFARM